MEPLYPHFYADLATLYHWAVCIEIDELIDGPNRHEVTPECSVI